MSFYEFFLQLGLFLVSLISNFLSALAGGGAGLVQLPALILLGLPFPIALATHKIASVALGFGATFRHFKESSLNLWFACYFLLCGLPGVWIGANIVLGIEEKIASLLLGILTISIGIYSILNYSLGTSEKIYPLNIFRLSVGAFVLFFIGLLNGSLTSGTGLFVTIWLVHWFGFDYKKAIAYTLILVGIFWNGTGALVLGGKGQIAWQWLPILLIGSLAGGYIGAHLSIAKGSPLVKRAFEILTLVMGTSMLIKSL